MRKNLLFNNFSLNNIEHHRGYQKLIYKNKTESNYQSIYYFEYIIKKQDALLGHMIETLTDNPQTQIYVNRIEKRITFKIIRQVILNFYHLKQRNYSEALKKV